MLLLTTKVEETMNTKLFELIQGIKHKCTLFEEQIINEYNLLNSEFYGLLVLKPGEKITQNMFSKRLGVSISRGSRILTLLLQKKYPLLLIWLYHLL